jgi:hypothetical protein
LERLAVGGFSGSINVLRKSGHNTNSAASRGLQTLYIRDHHVPSSCDDQLLPPQRRQRPAYSFWRQLKDFADLLS